MLDNNQFLKVFNRIFCGEMVSIQQDEFGNQYLASGLTWEEAKPHISTLLMLLYNEYNNEFSEIWFHPTDPYVGGKPFKICNIGLTKDGEVLLYVEGQKSDRIENKWTKKLSTFFEYPVELRWVL